MRKSLLLFMLLISSAIAVNAQRVELTGFGGYVFASRLEATEGYVRFRDNAWYGGQLSIAVSRVMDIDLLYNRSDTWAEASSIYDYYEEIPLSINYMMLGFTKNFRVNPTVSPYMGFDIGACVMAPKEDYMDSWFLAMGLNAGAKIYLGNRFGIKIQAQALAPIQGAGFTMFVGTGGSGGGVSVYSTMVQFGFTGGLIFRLGPVTTQTRK